MNDSKFEKIFDVLNFKKTEIAQYFYVYGMRFVQTAKQMKSQGYSGRDVTRKVNEFDAELNEKLSILLNETEQVFLKMGRKLSSEQCEKLSLVYRKTWKDIIKGFKSVVSQEFEVAGTLEVMFSSMEERYCGIITRRFDSVKVMEKVKIDQNLRWTKISVIVAIIVAIAGVIVPIVLDAQAPASSDYSSVDNETIKTDIETIKDSVVMIKVYDKNNELMATGSGFCAYEENWIVTNFHVIEGVYVIKVVTDDDEVFSAKEVVLFSPEEDLAIIATDGKLKPLKLGNGKNIQTKDNVTAIGSPKGEKNTVSEGIISNVDNKKEIRITAPISHGSSGGVLLNDKNQVIGITSAGYDEAQNLNFAINIYVLEELYSDYEKKDVTYLSYSNAWEFEGELDDFENNLVSSKSCFSSPSLSVFYSLTNDRERFESLLESEEHRNIDTLSWYSIYRYFDEESKSLVVDVFTELNAYEFDGSDLEAEIVYWDDADFLLGLNVLDNYEYAIIATDFATMNGWDSHFDRVHDYPLNTAESCLVLYLVGGYDWDDIHTDNKEDIFDYFNEKYGNDEIETIQEFGTILEWLGYDVVYQKDGNLTAYW